MNWVKYLTNEELKIFSHLVFCRQLDLIWEIPFGSVEDLTEISKQLIAEYKRRIL